MSIRNLDINKITQQYLEYVERMQDLNFDIAGDYLYMAAVLLFLKSQSFVSEEDVQQLVGEEVESDFQHISSEVELIKRLQELKRYQELGQQLWALPRVGHDIYLRPKVDRQAIRNEMVNSMDLQELVNAWISCLRKQKRKYKVVARDQFSIKERLDFLKMYLKLGERADFFGVLKGEVPSADKKRAHMIMTFISLLELARLKKIKIFQNEKYGNIFIDVQESLAGFNVSLANGFESEDERSRVAEASLHH